MLDPMMTPKINNNQNMKKKQLSNELCTTVAVSYGPPDIQYYQKI